MQEFTLEGIQDLWDDYSTAIVTESVDLGSAMICQYKSSRKKTDTEDTVILLVTSAATMKQEKKTLTVSNKITPSLKRIGCFYQIGKKRYLPTNEVQSHCLYDYFDVRAGQTGNGFFDNEASMLLASRFRSVRRIRFISMRKNKGFCKLIGMKTMSGCNQDTVLMDIAKQLHADYHVRFYSGYAEQKRLSMDFQVFCRIADSQTSNGFPLYILVSDNVTARRSVEIAVVADMENRLLKLQSMYINHRTLIESEQIVESALNMLHECETISLATGIDGCDIVEALMPYVPKKSRALFTKYVTEAESPVKAAYDIMGMNIFNPMSKHHKTQSYDGGKGKYEEALGSLLIN